MFDLSGRIKNVAVAGHGGSGKTSLCEAILYLNGVTDRLGKIADGNTYCDFDAEEIKRKAIEEYLAQQKAKEDSADADNQ